jgi:DNA repair photolyase
MSRPGGPAASTPAQPATIKGRGTARNPKGRFESSEREATDDGWDSLAEPLPPQETTLFAENARSIISTNDSPDLHFNRSINPYRGCEHGCIYCFARPSHAYLNLSPGLDFETKIFYKPNAAALLEASLRKPQYRAEEIVLGANTDPYQPVEAQLRLTRSILEVLQRFRHPVFVITKGVLVERDIDLLAEMASRKLAGVGISLATLDPALKRVLEPRAASPAARLRSMRRLADAGIPVTVLYSPIIPFINDSQLEQALEAAVEAGARNARYSFLRLSHELKDLFRDWLAQHAPDRAEHVMSLIRQSRDGAENDAQFGQRMRGTGPYAEMLAQRFRVAVRRLGLDRHHIELDTQAFRVPSDAGQGRLFD